MKIDIKEIEKQIIAITQKFLSELEAERAVQAVSLDATFDHELGIDSLGKVELFHRVENNFDIHLPENALADVNSPRELALLVEKIDALTPIKINQTFTPMLAAATLDVSSFSVLTDALKNYAANEPNRPHIYLQDESGKERIIRYGELLEGAQCVARGLHNQGILPGETIAIMLPTTDEFFYVFAGILLAGAIPVPIYPPFRADQIEEYAKREARILKNAQVRLLITFSRVKILADLLKPFIPSLKAVMTFDQLQSKTGALPDVEITPQHIAFMQYTSGSTGDPKGVVLTHANILANLHAIEKKLKIQPTDVNVSWLPLYHDMGLINWLASLYFAIPLTIMSPLIFLARPEKWLWAIHYHRGTLSAAPNFAYELCTREINPKDIEGLDLSSLRFAFCGAETINPKTIHQFIQKFERYGLKPEAFTPAFGLAESTVALTIHTKKSYPRIDKIERHAFEKENRAIPTESSDEKEYLEFVCCGETIPDHLVQIVDDNGNKLNERVVGNIQFSGPSSMQGYFDNPSATQKAYHNGFWDTGDLGYITDNELFVTGRKKDLIIKAGRNIYPEEIEEIVNEVTGIIRGCAIAFGVNDAISGTEKLVVVAETFQSQKAKRDKIRADIIKKMTTILGIPADTIVLCSPHTIPKTASGKLQRSECKKNYLAGKMGRRALPAKLQLVKIGLRSFFRKIRTGFTAVLKYIYAIYVAIILFIIMAPTWVSLFFLPKKLSAKLCRFSARMIFRLMFCPIKISGKEYLQNNQRQIYIANHASYADALLMIAILPPGVIFTGKKEVMHYPFIRTFVKKLNVLPLDRIDLTKSLEDSKSIESTLKEEKSILLFPEGTFTYATGLRPFKLGAFQLSSETQTPICPIAIRGTRAILREGSFIPTPGKITVTVSEPIYPKGNDWNETLRLHAIARAEIAKHCGEAVIDVIGAGVPLTV